MCSRKKQQQHQQKLLSAEISLSEFFNLQILVSALKILNRLAFKSFSFYHECMHSLYSISIKLFILSISGTETSFRMNKGLTYSTLTIGEKIQY